MGEIWMESNVNFLYGEEFRVNIPNCKIASPPMERTARDASSDCGKHKAGSLCGS